MSFGHVCTVAITAIFFFYNTFMYISVFFPKIYPHRFAGGAGGGNPSQVSTHILLEHHLF